MSLYEDLGVSEDATKAEIRQAFRKKAQSCHPDKDGDIDEFKTIQKAYSILKDKDKRERYDKTGSTQPFDVDTNAMNNLAEVFMVIVMKEEKGNIVDLAIEMIMTQLGKAKKNQAVNKKKLQIFEKYLNRVKVKRGHNLYRDVILKKIAEIKNQDIATQNAIDMYIRMQELAKEYEDMEPEEKEPEVIDPFRYINTGPTFFTGT